MTLTDGERLIIMTALLFIVLTLTWLVSRQIQECYKLKTYIKSNNITVSPQDKTVLGMFWCNV